MNDSNNPGVGRKWRIAKIGAAMMLLSIVLFALDVYLMMKLSTKIAFFQKASDYLMIVGSAFVTWNVYNVYFRK